MINPKFVVLSVGVNTHGHPSSETIFRIQTTKNLENDYLLRTDHSGSITFGNINGNVCYSLQNFDKEASYAISWEILSSVVCGVVLALIIFVRPKSSRSSNSLT